jgi:hypothetical protein
LRKNVFLVNFITWYEWHLSLTESLFYPFL